MQEGSFFSTLSPVFIVCRFFDDGHSDWCEVIPHCSFDSLIINDVEHLFHVFFGHLLYSFSSESSKSDAYFTLTLTVNLNSHQIHVDI